ncbi:MAG: putative lipopolysaccharide heptosyltransferase III [Campylobacterales bacterium]
MRVLVMKFRHIGDVILITPLLRNLKLLHPDWEIDVAVNRGTEELLQLNPDISRLFCYDRRRIKKLPFPKRLLEEGRFFLELSKGGYDIVINLTEGDRGALIATLSKAPIKIGYPPKKGILKGVYTHPLPPQQKRHTLEANLDPLRVLGEEIREKQVYIYWEEEAEEQVEQLGLPSQFIHLHLVSRWMFKTLPLKVAQAVIEEIWDRLRIPFVATGAPVKGEMEYLKELERLLPTQLDFLNLAGELTLQEVAALNKRAHLFLGVDTAVMHISAANDTPTFAFFGPSGAFHWGPWANREMESGYRAQNGIQRMGPHLVYQLDWECIPCGKDGCHGSKRSECLEFLSPSRVVEEFLEWRKGWLQKRGEEGIDKGGS